MISKRIAYFPFKILFIFLLFTEILLFIGPLHYDLELPLLLGVYLLILNLSLYLGYKRGITKYKFHQSSTTINDVTIIKTFIILSLFVVSPMNLLVNWGLNSVSPGAIWEKFIEGLTNPADVYLENLEFMQKGLGGGGAIMHALLSFISFAAIPLGIVYWKSLSKTFHLFIFFLIFLEIVFWIGIGTRKGLLDILLITILMIIATNKQLLDDSKKRKKMLLGLIVFLALFMFYFIYSNLSRSTVDLKDLNNIDIAVIGLDVKPFYENYVSPVIYIPLSSITNYLCQGYYALSCALKVSLEQTVFTYGYGNNTFTMVLLENLFGYDYDYLLSQTYQGILDKKYAIHPTVNWHSLYVWLANDFTFFGVPIIIYFIGYLFSTTWLDTLTKSNLYSAPLFAFFAIMVFYAFANNQVLSSSFMAFVIVFILYLTRKIKLTE